MRKLAIFLAVCGGLYGQAVQMGPQSPGIVPITCPTGKFLSGFTFGSWTCTTPGVSGAGGNPNQILWNSAGAQGGFTFSQDLTLAPSTGYATVQGIQGRSVAATAPANGQAYTWNASANQWQPTSILTGTGGTPNQILWNNAGGQGGFTFSQDLTLVPLTGYATVQGIQGRVVAGTPPLNGQAYLWNSTAQQWQPGSVTTTTGGSPGQLLWNSGGSQAGLNLSQDVTLIPATGAATVQGIQGNQVAATAPTNGQAYLWNAGAAQWQPGTPASSPGGSANQILWNNAGASAGFTFNQDLLLAPLTGAATVQGFVGRALSYTAPTNGQAYLWNSGTSQWTPGSVAGSVGGSSGQILWNNAGASAGFTPSQDMTVVASTGVVTVTGLQGSPIAPVSLVGVPFNGASLVFNSSIGSWEPGNASLFGAVVSTSIVNNGTTALNANLTTSGDNTLGDNTYVNMLTVNSNAYFGSAAITGCLHLWATAGQDTVLCNSGSNIAWTLPGSGSTNQVLSLGAGGQWNFVTPPGVVAVLTSLVGPLSNSAAQVIGYTIPANTIAAGTTYTIEAYGYLSNSGSSSADTFSIELGTTTLSGNVLVSSAPNAVASAVGQGLHLRAKLTYWGPNVSASVEVCGTSSTTFTTTCVVNYAASATITTTVSNVLELDFLSAASTSTIHFNVATITLDKP